LISRDPDLGGELDLAVGAFRLKPLAVADAADLLAHYADPRVVAFMDIEPLSDIEQAGHIIDWATAQRAVGAGLRWTIRAGDGAFVGTCGFNRLDLERGRRGEIAYDLAHGWWGRGVLTAVLPAIVAFGFGRLALHRLEAMVTPGNARSGRVLERHGFAREGLLRGYGFWKGRYWDQIVYSRLAPTAQGMASGQSSELEVKWAPRSRSID
jgi:ribosomal-protein-alanine N-acetyltransferase